jgi:hypothetical protein
MAKLGTYESAFPHAKLTRSPDGVLEVVLHTDGDTLVFDGHTHEEFVDLFHQIGQDADNRVVILTGALWVGARGHFRGRRSSLESRQVTGPARQAASRPVRGAKETARARVPFASFDGP